MSNQPAIFGVRCDAITKNGKRCKKMNLAEIPCAAVYATTAISYRAKYFRPVRLCACHADMEWFLRKSGKRLKLHHGGWLGPLNEYNYGNLVINKPTINWSSVKRFIVPKFWRNATQKII